MEIIAIKNGWDVTVELNNHETLLLLQSLKDDIRQARIDLPKLANALKDHPDMHDITDASLSVANDKIKLHNELLPCYRSDYEHLMLEPIELK